MRTPSYSTAPAAAAVKLVPEVRTIGATDVVPAVYVMVLFDNACAASVPATVVVASGSVRILSAVNVVGVTVTSKDEVPPARPAITTASWVAAASERIALAALNVFAAVNILG
jgi:hypothetical protein